MNFSIDQHNRCQQILRRQFLSGSALGLGSIAFGDLFASGKEIGSEKRNPEAKQNQSQIDGILKKLHYKPKAKRVIFLCMAGGPSHLETFDPKPQLEKLSGKPMPDSFTKGQPIAQLQGKKLICQGALTKYRQHGKSGQWISNFLPHTAKIADDICILRSLKTDQINHDPAHTLMNTGTSISGRPSMGSWVQYGLGSESKDLPGFVVLTSVGGRNPQPIASRQWHSGFLPSKNQGVEFYSKGDPVHYVRNLPGVSKSDQARAIEAIKRLNRIRNRHRPNPEIETRIAQYELAFRMQDSIPQLVDFSDEPQSVLDMYGIKEAKSSFASNCLLARRMAQRGVRFIQLYHRGWDHHGDLKKFMGVCCRHCDQASAALVQDLKQHGLLEDTLVIWGGEFGRTPMFQGKGASAGRDHHIRGFSMWMAGGGIKPGFNYGQTDELGYNAVENPIYVNDLHATILALLGIDHTKLTYPYQGRDFRLTDVAGEIIHPIIT